jgi:NAD(P)-dependent dehydrogenase (short-subunit alcohol dehydrogenase family)
MRDSQTPSDRSATTAKVVLITGTSSGIGLASAIAAARAGWRTVATMRDLESSTRLTAAAAAASVELDIQKLDVTEPEAITRILRHIEATYGRLDALLNNAGAAALGTVEMMTMEQFRDSMEVNFFGAVALTRAVFPLLRESGGRVVTITSVGGAVGQPFNEAYCAAKFALEGFLESLHPVAKSVGVAVTVVEPAAVTSDFVANASVDQSELLAEAGPYRSALALSLARTMRQFDPSVAQSSDDVAAVVLASLEDAAPAFRVQSSATARAFVGAKLADLDGSRVTGLTSSWVRTRA